MSEGKLTEYAVYLECKWIDSRQPEPEFTFEDSEAQRQLFLPYDEDLATLFQKGQRYKVTITRAEDEE